MKATQRLYLNADKTRIVLENDPASAYLFAVEGDEISNEDAKRYGLQPETKAEKAAPEDKAVKNAPEDKGEATPEGETEADAQTPPRHRATRGS